MKRAALAIRPKPTVGRFITLPGLGRVRLRARDADDGPPTPPVTIRAASRISRPLEEQQSLFTSCTARVHARVRTAESAAADQARCEAV